MKFVTLFLCLLFMSQSPQPTPAPTSIVEAMAYASAIDLELDVYIADAQFAGQERVAIRRVQNDLHMLDSRLIPTPYVGRVQHLVEDFNALVRLDQTLAKEEWA